MTLATQADVEAILGVEFDDDPDANVAIYLAQADAAIASYCGQPLTWADSLTDTFDGPDNTEWHVLPRFPVTSVTSVVEDGSTLTYETQYRWEPDGRIRRLNGQLPCLWSRYPDANVVTYAAGYGTGAPAPYDTVPPDVVLVASTFAAALYKQAAQWAAHGTDGPVKSVALDGSDTITYDNSASSEAVSSSASGAVDLSEGMMALLAPYRRRAL